MLYKKRRIFISYDRDDLEIAASLRQALRAEGLDVWWDDDLRSGEHWAEIIDKQLSRVLAIVALWSNNSVESDWVRHEASIGQSRKVLTHARIDSTAVPTPFASTQLADLTGWDMKESYAEFRKLVDSIKKVKRQQRARTALRAAALLALLVVPFSAAWTLQTQRLKAPPPETPAHEVWRARVPIRLRSEDNKPIEAAHGELRQVQIELEPPTIEASANEVAFWLVRDNERFPTARFTIPTMSLTPEVLDLGDRNRMMHDPEQKTMVGIAPIWITVGPAYSPGRPDDRR